MPHIAIGSDHAGFDLKAELIALATAQPERFAHATFTDVGTHTNASCDYPDYAHAVANALSNTENDSTKPTLGILICGSGIGVSIAANRHAHIRAAICWNESTAVSARSHNNANVLCLPSRQISTDTAARLLELFLHTPFEGGRHERRVEKIELPNTTH